MNLSALFDTPPALTFNDDGSLTVVFSPETATAILQFAGVPVSFLDPAQATSLAPTTLGEAVAADVAGALDDLGAGDQLLARCDVIGETAPEIPVIGETEPAQPVIGETAPVLRLVEDDADTEASSE